MQFTSTLSKTGENPGFYQALIQPQNDSNYVFGCEKFDVQNWFLSVLSKTTENKNLHNS